MGTLLGGLVAWDMFTRRDSTRPLRTSSCTRWKPIYRLIFDRQRGGIDILECEWHFSHGRIYRLDEQRRPWIIARTNGKLIQLAKTDPAEQIDQNQKWFPMDEWLNDECWTADTATAIRLAFTIGRREGHLIWLNEHPIQAEPSTARSTGGE
jgi:hypothetical protein